MLRGFLAAAVVLGAFIAAVHAQTRTVAVTFDDLPAADTRKIAEALDINRTILDALVRHHVPAIGFVIEANLESMGTPKQQNQLLESWIHEGELLGNHTYSHADFDKLTLEQEEQEILGGEKSVRPLLKKAARPLVYLRFPYNHTGDTQQKHDAIAVFLRERGYKLATCTIDNSDYLFADAYRKMLTRGDAASAARLRSDYLACTSAEIDYYSHLDEQVFGREIPHVMLLHANRLNADMIEDTLRMFEAKGYKFVTLEQEQSDAAYATPDTFATAYGPMWGYRWAHELGVKVDGRLEPDPPTWVLKYGTE
jgi:peptidoglycan/xylan/chitin deacetylase (PgdA/CDA1 family)